MQHTMNGQLQLPAAVIDIPLTLVVGGASTNPAAGNAGGTNAAAPAPAPAPAPPAPAVAPAPAAPAPAPQTTTVVQTKQGMGAFGGLIAGLLIALLLGLLGWALYGALSSDPNVVAGLARVEASVVSAQAADSAALARLEASVATVAVDASNAAIHAQIAAQKGTDALNALAPIARDTRQARSALDKIGGVTYDAAGNVTGTATLADAVAAAKNAEAAAKAAEEAAKKRPRVVVRTTENPRVLAALERIEAGLNQPEPEPHLERLE